MRLTQGTFSYLPDLTDDEIARQIAYGLANGWSVAVEFTDDPHPRNAYWHLWGTPAFGLDDPAEALHQIRRCREAFPGHYIRVSLHDPSRKRMTTALQFLVHRPPHEEAFRLERLATHDRTIRYTLRRAPDRRPPSTTGDGVPAPAGS